MASGKRSVPRNKKISRKYVRRRILVLLVFLCLILGLLYGLYRLVAAGIAAIGKKQQLENTPPPVETALSTPPPATALPELVTIQKDAASISAAGFTTRIMVNKQEVQTYQRPESIFLVRIPSMQRG